MAKVKRGTEPLTGVTPRIITEINDSTALYYINHMEVANTALDFTLLCARLPAKLSAEKMEELKTKKTLHIDADVQIVMPVFLIPALIKRNI
jgi:hypothetical protein